MNQQQVTDYIEDAPEDQKKIMETIRKIIHESVNGCEENYKWSRPVFSKGHDFAYLQKTKNHITLGFMNYAKIDDRDNQLEGTGKDMRHIKVKGITDIQPKKLKEWFMAVSSK